MARPIRSSARARRRAERTLGQGPLGRPPYLPGAPLKLRVSWPQVARPRLSPSSRLELPAPPRAKLLAARCLQGPSPRPPPAPSRPGAPRGASSAELPWGAPPQDGPASEVGPAAPLAPVQAVSPQPSQAPP